ncbi:MAG: ABC transporter permease [Propionibacteriaceae bacterium]|nr:ABC transporter permease [Propionibacteriaceae bacterium]
MAEQGWAHAWAEIRHQPGRFVAMLAAIVVSVAFLAASQVLLATESNALAQRTVLHASRADVIVTSHLWHWPRGRDQRDRAVADAEAALRADPRVTAVERFSQVRSQVLVGEQVADVMLTSIQDHPDLRWYEPTQGRLPSAPDEVVLTASTATLLGVGVGDTLHLNLAGTVPLTLVGITDQRGYATPPGYVTFDLIADVESALPPADYRVLVNPRDTESTTPGASSGGVGLMLLAKTHSAEDAEPVRAATQQALDKKGWMRIIAEAHLGSDLVAEAVAAQGRDGWADALVTGSAGISLLVGALIIANTFSILLAQRRRQIGLLRAVGATRGQVVGRYLGEAVALGVVGAALGIPLALGASALVALFVTHSWPFGLVVAWDRLLVVAGIGVLATVLAAVVPVLRASRATPLEALRPVVPPPARRQPGPAESPRSGSEEGGHPLLHLAILNVGRNPRRSVATASALLLAVGLIVLVQVAAGSARGSAFAALDARHPIDVGLQAAVMGPELANPQGAGPETFRDEDGRLLGFTPDALPIVLDTPGVAEAVMVPTSEPMILFSGAGVYDQMPVAALTEEAQRILRHPIHLEPDQVGLSAEAMGRLQVSEGGSLTLFTPTGPSAGLRVVEANVGPKLLMVHPDEFARLAPESRPGLILTKLADPDTSDSVVNRLTARLIGSNPGLDVSGSAEQKAVLRALLDDITAIMTGLLAVAAVVALVGVGNTLGLSVLERRRENALLRALGVPASGLRWMLLVEALALSVAAAVVGVALGVLLGWGAAAAVLRARELPPPELVVDPWQTLGTVLVVVAAGALASLLPGRRAALASPVEAMADDG